MRKQVFYDIEFIETQGSIELISLGAVDQDGNEFYEVSSEFNEDKAPTWIKENVIPKLGDKERIPRKELAKKFLEFIGEEGVDLWAYYSAYDHVVLMWLFGVMVDKPAQLPMFTHDLQQILSLKGLKGIPFADGEHNALEDAKWNLELWKYLGSPEPELNRESNGSVFLGGTCNESTWRDSLINKFSPKVNYFNPVVKDWDEEAQKREEEQRKNSAVNLFVITPKMKGVFSIAEVVDCSNKRPSTTVFSIMVKDGEEVFEKFALKSLIEVARLVKSNGARVVPSVSKLEGYLSEL